MKTIEIIATKGATLNYSFAKSERNATTKKAIPAQNILPVRNHTMKATIAAGSTNKKTLTSSTIMASPITNSIISTTISNIGPKS